MGQKGSGYGGEDETSDASAGEHEAHGCAAVGGEVFWCYADDGEVEEGGADAIEEALRKEEVPDL